MVGAPVTLSASESGSEPVVHLGESCAVVSQQSDVAWYQVVLSCSSGTEDAHEHEFGIGFQSDVAPSLDEDELFELNYAYVPNELQAELFLRLVDSAGALQFAYLEKWFLGGGRHVDESTFFAPLTHVLLEPDCAADPFNPPLESRGCQRKTQRRGVRFGLGGRDLEVFDGSSELADDTEFTVGLAVSLEDQPEYCDGSSAVRDAITFLVH